MTPIKEFLTRKFLDWQSNEGEIKTVQEFAKYLNVNRSLLSFWMNGVRIPSEENVHKMAKKLGNEIYEAMNLPRPNPYLQRIKEAWEFIPEAIQKKIAEEAEQYETQNDLQRAEKNDQRRKTRKAD